MIDWLKHQGSLLLASEVPLAEALFCASCMLLGARDCVGMFSDQDLVFVMCWGARLQGLTELAGHWVV